MKHDKVKMNPANTEFLIFDSRQQREKCTAKETDTAEDKYRICHELTVEIKFY